MIVLARRTNADQSSTITRAWDTAAPGVGDDANDGHEVGTVWEVRDANGKFVKEYMLLDSTVGAAVWRLVEDEDSNRKVFEIEEALVFNGDASKDLATQLPANAIPLFATLNYDAAMTLTTAVKMGFGVAGTVSGYCLSGTGVTKNTKTSGKGSLCGAMVAAPTTITITACATGGTAAGTAVGTVRARLYYELYDQLPDA